MKKWQRIVLMLIVGIGGILGVGYWYQEAVQKHEPVWIPGAPTMEVPMDVWLHYDFATVRVDTDEVLSDVIEGINKELGCTVFTDSEVFPLKQGQGANDVPFNSVMINGQGLQDRPPSELGSSWLHKTENRFGEWNWWAEIIFEEGRVSRLSELELQLALAHELYHVLGLADDWAYKLPVKKKGPLFVSIMTKEVTEHAIRFEHGLHIPRLSDTDRGALQQKYCQ